MLSLEDRSSIHATTIGFFVALDRFDDDRILESITTDMQWIRSSGNLTGRDEVATMLASRSRSRITRHLVCNVDIQGVTPTEARVSLDVLVLQGIKESSGASPTDAVMLISSDDVFRVEGGQWKLALKRPSAVFNNIS